MPDIPNYPKDFDGWIIKKKECHYKKVLEQACRIRQGRLFKSFRRSFEAICFALPAEARRSWL